MTFRPKLLDTLREYSKNDFLSDLTAGVTVGIVALPLAMAFGIASGVDPKTGIYTAIIAGFLISALGGSRVQIGGPTGAFIAIVYSVVVQYGLNNLILCTFMAGVILLAMGFARMGAMIKFIPHPVVTGFTSGIAVIVFSTQIKDFCGLSMKDLPADFVQKIRVLATNLGSIHWPTLVLGIISLGLIFFWPKKLAKRIPGSVVALFLMTFVVAVFQWPIETIGSRFGEIPRALPPLQFPIFSFSDVQNLIRPAFTIALLAAMESLMCAVVADGMIDDRHDSNQELMAQGLANIGSSLFGGMPATGAIARTATNVKNGGRTPVAGIIHAFTLLLILLLAAPLAKNIPLAVLAAVLIYVAYNMGEWHNFARLTKWPRSDAVVFLATFSLTVLVDLTVAVEVGMVLAAILFIRRVSETTQITHVDESTETEGAHDSLIGKTVPEGVIVFRVFGAFFFGAADKLETALDRTTQQPKVLILRVGKVFAIDASGLNALDELLRKLRRKHRHLVLSGPHSQPLMAMHKSGFVERLGEANLCENLDASLDRARTLLHLPNGHEPAGNDIDS